MITPSRYNTLRASRNADEVSFGCGGLYLFKVSEIEQKQVGYSVASNGTSLCGGGDGAWRPSWVVIGHDTACGDPLILETSDPALPVLTAIHGEGAWEPVTIAVSLDAFLASLEEFALLSADRSNPVIREANPLTENERNSFLTRISALNNQRIDLNFWESLLEC
jgi:hypothetical protein